MREIIENIKSEDLDSIPMDYETYINSVEYKNYYQERSSKEHYRLLTFLSFLFNDSKIIDVGSLKGSSALALSTNQTNTVYSFDISNSLDLNHVPSNINFINDEVTSGRYDDLILESNKEYAIIFDTKEKAEAMNVLLDNKYKLEEI